MSELVNKLVTYRCD